MDRTHIGTISANGWHLGKPVNKRGFSVGTLFTRNYQANSYQVFAGVGNGPDDDTPPQDWVGATFANGQPIVLSADTMAMLPEELAAVSWIRFGPYGDQVDGEVVCQFIE